MRKTRILCQIYLATALSVSLQAQSAIVSVTDFGAFSDGSNSAATTAAFTQAFAAAAPTGKVIVPPGDYAIDNSTGAFTINNYNGEFKFEGNSRVVFNTSSQPGIAFKTGWGLRISGFHSTYSSPAASQVPDAPALSFTDTTNTFLNEVIVENSSGTAIYFSNCLEPKISNTAAIKSRGEGIRFNNSRNVEVANATVTDSSMDAIVFSTASGTTGRDGALVTNVAVTGSKRRGIVVLGKSKVTITSFTVESADMSAIYCGTDSGMALPNQVLYQGGIIKNSAGFGIEFNGLRTCSFANIQVVATGDRGVSGTASVGSVDLRNIRVSSNQLGDGFNFTNVATVRISDCTAENSPGYGFYFNSVGNTIANALTASNVSSQSPLNRAIWFENGASVLAFDLVVLDNRSAPAGFNVGTVAITRGALHSIASNIPNGSLQIQNLSPGVNVTQVD